MWRAGALPIRTIHLISKWAGEPTELENSKLEIVFFGFVRKTWLISNLSPSGIWGENLSTGFELQLQLGLETEAAFPSSRPHMPPNPPTHLLAKNLIFSDYIYMFSFASTNCNNHYQEKRSCVDFGILLQCHTNPTNPANLKTNLRIWKWRKGSWPNVRESGAMASNPAVPPEMKILKQEQNIKKIYRRFLSFSKPRYHADITLRHVCLNKSEIRICGGQSDLFLLLFFSPTGAFSFFLLMLVE